MDEAAEFEGEGERERGRGRLDLKRKGWAMGGGERGGREVEVR